MKQTITMNVFFKSKVQGIVRRFFLLISVLGLVATQAVAKTTTVNKNSEAPVASTVVPSDGTPEHLFAIYNASGTDGYWSIDLYSTNSSSTTIGLFAFYAVSGKADTYYIYNCTAKKWVVYDAASIANGKSFLKLSDTQSATSYFAVSANTITEETGFFNKTITNYNGYAIHPYDAEGNVSGQYLNFAGGNSANTSSTVGLYDDGSKDKASLWFFTENNNQTVTAVCDFLQPSTSDTPEYVYTMHNEATEPIYIGADMMQDNQNHAKFAFYPVEGKSNAYYIYNYNTKQWLSYEKKITYSSTTNFVKMSDNRENYFCITRCVKDGKSGYHIQPYGSWNDNSAADYYLNYYQGNGDNVLGIYSDSGNKDNGSFWWLDATDHELNLLLSEEATRQSFAAQPGVNVQLQRTLGTGYWNTFCVPFDLDATQIAAVLGADADVRTFDNMEGTVMNFKKVQTVEAGKPYLVKVQSEVANPSFENVDLVSGEPTKVGDDATGYYMQGIYGTKNLTTDGTNLFLADGDKFKKPAEGKNTMKGMRAFFVVPAGTEPNALRANIDDAATAIDTVERNATIDAAPVYTLQGQRVGNTLQGLARGVYVQNGKKYVVR